MTREEDFRQHSQRRWFAIACLYWPPYRFMDANGVEKLAFQVLAASDVESEYMMEALHTTREPAPFTAQEVIDFINATFAKHGRSSQGIVVLPSVWESTERLYSSHDTRERVEAIYQAGIRIVEMDAGHRFQIASYVQSLGMELAWSENQVPDLDTLLDH